MLNVTVGTGQSYGKHCLLSQLLTSAGRKLRAYQPPAVAEQPGWRSDQFHPPCYIQIVVPVEVLVAEGLMNCLRSASKLALSSLDLCPFRRSSC